MVGEIRDEELSTGLDPVSSEIFSDLVSDLSDISSDIYDLYKICYLFLYVSSFASQNQGISFGDECFDVCCENKNFWFTSNSPQ